MDGVAEGNAVTMRWDVVEILTCVCVSREIRRRGKRIRIRRTMNENATRGRNVPGGMKEGTSFVFD